MGKRVTMTVTNSVFDSCYGQNGAAIFACKCKNAVYPTFLLTSCAAAPSSKLTLINSTIVGCAANRTQPQRSCWRQRESPNHVLSGNPFVMVFALQRVAACSPQCRPCSRCSGRCLTAIARRTWSGCKETARAGES
jgi:hypothetical protein